MKRFFEFFCKGIPAISKPDAIKIAKRECCKNNWPWLDPIKVKFRRQRWLVETNWRSRGANAKIEIDGNTGAIIDARYWPR